MTPEQEHLVTEIISDFPRYAEEWLKIRDKPGAIKPFVLNRAQMHVHKCLEDQLRDTGMVRAVVLKGRQQGMSTYIAARFFHHTITRPGKRTYILAHEQAASDNLFAMAQRYFEHYPDFLRPVVKSSSAKELSFRSLDSGYKVATAGSKGAGRSDTAQFVHGSEVAYWPNAESHLSGLLQTVPLIPGTEIVFESTADGIGNTYHDIWQQGTAGKGGWQSIFVPWYWQSEYQIFDESVTLDEDDTEYGKLMNLTLPQQKWRRYKIGELGSELQFKREYPTNPAEAFEVSNDMALLTDDAVLKARKATATAYGPKILGVDPARSGRDRTVLIMRQGRVAEIVGSVNGADTMAVVAMVIKLLRSYNPNAVFIDVGGIGAGIVDRLREMGYRFVRGVDFGSTSLEPERYTNKRNEIWQMTKQWVEDQPAQLPDNDTLQEDLCGIQIKRYDSHNRAILESKDEFKKRFKRSPDHGDALALTFAFPVRDERVDKIDMMSYDDGAHVNTVPGMGY